MPNIMLDIDVKVDLPDPWWLLLLADGLDSAVRQGNDLDTPEGSRYITVSDTLAKEISKGLRKIARKLRLERDEDSTFDREVMGSWSLPDDQHQE